MEGQSDSGSDKKDNAVLNTSPEGQTTTKEDLTIQDAISEIKKVCQGVNKQDIDSLSQAVAVIDAICSRAINIPSCVEKKDFKSLPPLMRAKLKYENRRLKALELIDKIKEIQQIDSHDDGLRKTIECIQTYIKDKHYSVSGWATVPYNCRPHERNISLLSELNHVMGKANTYNTDWSIRVCED